MSKLVADTIPMPQFLIDAYPASRTGLLEYCCDHIDESMLDEISKADYQCDIEIHRKELDEIVARSCLTAPKVCYIAGSSRV